jgi:hypothetical protein
LERLQQAKIYRRRNAVAVKSAAKVESRTATPNRGGEKSAETLCAQKYDGILEGGRGPAKLAVRGPSDGIAKFMVGTDRAR